MSARKTPRKPGSSRSKAKTGAKSRGAVIPGRRTGLEVSGPELRWILDPSRLGFESTAELEPLEAVGPDPRALEAFKLGAEITSTGYNVFCLGLEGEDRLSLVKRLLEGLQPACRPAKDRCFVYNFRRAAAPRLIELPAGQGRTFERDVQDLVEQLRKHLTLVFEEERFGRQVHEITNEHQQRERDLLARLREQAEAAGFAVAQVESEDGRVGVDVLFRLGPHLFAADDLERSVHEARQGINPQLEEDPEADAELTAALAQLDVEDIHRAHSGLEHQLQRSMREARRLARTAQRQVAQLERQESLVVVEGAVAELASRHSGHEDVSDWLNQLKANVLDHLGLFKPGPGLEAESAEGQESPADPSLLRSWADLRERFRVNLMHDSLEENGCPILVESIPSIRNLFGSLGRNDPRRAADHRSIRSGSLLAADGGYLILDAADLISEPAAWRALKRVLLTQRLDLREAIAERDRDGSPMLRPDPIPLTTKIVMVGDHEVYHYLHSMDPDFQHAFKVRAEFDWLVPRTLESVRRLGGQVRQLCESEDLPPFDAGAVAALAEHAARVGEEATRMASSFHLLADPCRQAALYARRAGGDVVRAEEVQRSLVDAERRCSLGSEHQRTAIREGRILISTGGAKVGEVNGLAVSSTIEHAFGYPVRITAVAAHGTAGLINIEREAKLSGTIHDKGMFIVQGYLNRRYGHAAPLTITASVAFEQLYGGIDGDSATAAEIYALLSSLSGVPLTSSIAVTGSVNQLGEVQPVGGVNEKIEGFFDACVGLAGGPERLPGDQGVLLPRANVGDLMLRPDVVEAVAAERFHVWAMERVDEGLELLTGRHAGELDETGVYPEGSLHAMVLDRLLELARHAADHEPQDGPSGPEAP